MASAPKLARGVAARGVIVVGLRPMRSSDRLLSPVVDAYDTDDLRGEGSCFRRDGAVDGRIEVALFPTGHLYLVVGVNSSNARRRDRRVGRGC